MLQRNQFTHSGLADVYFNGHSASIPQHQWGRSMRLLDTIDAATKPSDTKLSGSGYSVTGNQYRLAIDAQNSITYQWHGSAATKIDYA